MAKSPARGPWRLRAWCSGEMRSSFMDGTKSLSMSSNLLMLGNNPAPQVAVSVTEGQPLDIQPPEWLEQFEGLLETLNEGVIISDDCHNIVFVNSTFEEMTDRKSV